MGRKKNNLDIDVFDENIEVITDDQTELLSTDLERDLDEKNSETEENILPVTLDSDESESDEHYPLVQISTAGSFEQYLNAARNAPKLTPKEEWELACKLRNENDLEAAQRLVFSNLRYVIAIAQNYSGYGLPLSDLIQEGNVGLMRAVKRFDPDKKVKLMTFATHWIRAEIHEFIIKNWRIIKMATTKAQRKLFFKLRSTKPNLDWMSADEAKQLAEKLEVNVGDVYHMEGRMTQTDTAFDAPTDTNDDELALAPSQYLGDSTYSPEKIVIDSNDLEFQTKRMLEGLQQLDQRSQEIVKERWLMGNKATLKDLSEKYNISLERVRQIEARAMQKIKESIESSK